VCSDRGFAYIEFVRDLLHGEAGAETLKDRCLAGGEARGVDGCGGCIEFAIGAFDAMIYDMCESIFNRAFLQSRYFLRMKV
jgi:hypothetical protein